MNPDNCTMRNADWPTPPAKGALGTVLAAPALRPNAAAKATRARLRAKKGRR